MALQVDRLTLSFPLRPIAPVVTRSRLSRHDLRKGRHEDPTTGCVSARSAESRMPAKLGHDGVPASIATKSGGRGGNRTPDTGIFNPLLYQLSYPAGATPVRPEKPTCPDAAKPASARAR